MLQRTLEAAAGMIAPVLADVAVTSARRLLQRGTTGCWAPRSFGGSRSLPPGNVPGQTGHREGRVPDMPTRRVYAGDSLA